MTIRGYTPGPYSVLFVVVDEVSVLVLVVPPSSQKLHVLPGAKRRGVFLLLFLLLGGCCGLVRLVHENPFLSMSGSMGSVPHAIVNHLPTLDPSMNQASPLHSERVSRGPLTIDSAGP